MISLYVPLCTGSVVGFFFFFKFKSVHPLIDESLYIYIYTSDGTERIGSARLARS